MANVRLGRGSTGPVFMDGPVLQRAFCTTRIVDDVRQFIISIEQWYPGRLADG